MIEAFTDWGAIQVSAFSNKAKQDWVDDMFQLWAIVQQDNPFRVWE